MLFYRTHANLIEIGYPPQKIRRVFDQYCVPKIPIHDSKQICDVIQTYWDRFGQIPHKLLYLEEMIYYLTRIHRVVTRHTCDTNLSSRLGRLQNKISIFRRSLHNYSVPKQLHKLMYWMSKVRYHMQKQHRA